MKNYQDRGSNTPVRPTNRQESRFARIATEECGIGIYRVNGDIHDCLDAGGRATQEQLPREVGHEKLSGKRIFTHAARPTNRQESRFARIAPEGYGIGICRMNGDIQGGMS